MPFAILGRVGWIFLGAVALVTGWTGCENASGSRRPLVVHRVAPLYGEAAVTDGHVVWILGGCDTHGFLDGVIRYDPLRNESRQVGTLLAPRRYFAAVYRGDGIYVFGGRYAGGFAAEVERYDPGSNKSTVVSRMPTPRRAVTAVSWRGRIWTIGGSPPGSSDYGPRCPIVEVYDPASNSWTDGPPLPESAETSAVVIGDRLYVFGGYDGPGQVSRSVYRLEGDGVWERRPDLPWPVSADTVAEFGGEAYLFGDFTAMNRVARYDPQSGSATELSLDFIPRRHAAAVTLGDAIYVIGGNQASSGSALGVVQKFTAVQLEAR